MDKFKCPKCDAIYNMYIKECYINEKTQKIKRISTGKIFTHIVSHDVIYECSCQECGNF